VADFRSESAADFIPEQVADLLRNPQAWLADVLARINDLPQQHLHELLPWEWKQRHAPALAA
jgi:hypothetical protein